MSMEKLRKKFAKHPAVIRAFERTRARVHRERRLAVAAVVIASTATLDAVVQQRALEQAERPPPPGYVRSLNGGPELLPALTAAEQQEFLARLGRPR